MSSEFMPGRYTIGELIKNGTILGHKDGNFGSYYPKITDFGDVGVPLITAKVINNGRINFSEAQKLSFEKASSLPFGFIEENDVLLSHNATVGRVAIVPRLEGRVLIGTSLTYFRVNKERLLPHYLGAFFESRDFQNQLEAVMGLSTRNQVPITAQRLLTIEVPSLAVQTEIANCIQALDNRLNLLRETNATLEAIAQALFKSWFVDFDPVHANAGTQAPSLPPEIQALFPATFTDSPQGPIPKGWDLKVLYEVAEYVNGAAYKAFEPNLEKRGLPIIKIAELKAGVTDQTAYSDVLMKEKYKIDDRSILFSWSGNPDTSIDTFVWSHGPAWLNQHIFNVIPTDSSERSFVLMLLKHMKPIFTEIARDKQTTGLGHVTIADLKRLLVTIPEKQVLSYWNEIVDPIVERSFAVIQQMQNLVSLRDTLLPRLISGQLRFPEAEQAIAAITD
jgi:type I restriction enzyme S subunit